MAAPYTDSAGKGVVIGSTLTLAGTVSSIIHGGSHAQVTFPDGRIVQTRQQKSSPYTAGGAASLSGTVVGFTDGGRTAIVKEADTNLVTMTCALATAA